MIFLRSIRYKDTPPADRFPFSLPVFKSLDEIPFDAPVTFFVGENGSGKSTLIEAIAHGMDAVAVGSDSLEADPSLEHIRHFSSQLRFVKNRRPKRGFFFRAEDFFGFIKRIKREARDLRDLEDEYDETLEGYGRLLATGMARGQRSALSDRYGEDPDAFSHGESFLNLFQSRLSPEGLYILDEPETPLSPQKQLTFLSMLKQMVEQSCQFIIATHSPIIMAFPDARIYSFDQREITTIVYDDIEHVVLTRSFLKDPENYLRRL